MSCLIHAVAPCRMSQGMRPHGEVSLERACLVHWGGAMQNSLRCSGKLSDQQLQVWASKPAIKPLTCCVSSCLCAFRDDVYRATMLQHQVQES